MEGIPANYIIKYLQVQINSLLRCKLVIALEIEFGLVGRRSSAGSGDPGEIGEHGSLCFKLPDILSILKKLTTTEQKW